MNPAKAKKRWVKPQVQLVRLSCECTAYVAEAPAKAA